MPTFSWLMAFTSHLLKSGLHFWRSPFFRFRISTTDSIKTHSAMASYQNVVVTLHRMLWEHCHRYALVTSKSFLLPLTKRYHPFSERNLQASPVLLFTVCQPSQEVGQQGHQRESRRKLSRHGRYRELSGWYNTTRNQEQCFWRALHSLTIWQALGAIPKVVCCTCVMYFDFDV